MDVQTKRDGADRIFATDVQDTTGGHLLTTDNLSGRSDCSLPGGGRFFFHAWEETVEIVFEVVGFAHGVALKVDVIGGLTALKKHMRMKFQRGSWGRYLK